MNDPSMLPLTNPTLRRGRTPFSYASCVADWYCRIISCTAFSDSTVRIELTAPYAVDPALV